MRMVGTLEIVFSKALPMEAKDDIEKVIEYLNNDYLKKGTKDPNEAANIESFEIGEDRLIIKLNTGSKVRIDEASLRIRNVLSSILGRNYKIGVRNLKLTEPKILLDGIISVSISLPFIKKVYSEERRTIVELNDLFESDLKKPIFLRLLRLIEEKEKRYRWGGKAEHWILLKNSSTKPVLFYEDPNKILEEIGWIKRTSIGQWIYTPPLTHLLNSLKELFLDEVIKPLGFEEAIFPKMYPLEVGLKTGHLKGVINSMVFASLPKSYNISEFEPLIDYMTVMDEAPPKELQKYVEPPSYFLCFAQCEPFYWFFENEILDDNLLPVKWYDMSGPSFRWEAGGIHGIERIIEFHRIEVVWLGKPEQVIDIRNRLLEKYEYFLDKVLDLEWRLAWVTPWFYEHSGIVEEKIEIDIDRPGTVDIEVWLPYKGSREENKNWLEVGNISIHGTKFTQSFRIKHNKDETLWTGCSGFGSERWLIALLAQKGFDPSSWPKKYLEYVKRKPFPKSISTITYPKTKEGREVLHQIDTKMRV
ncbi:MAG: serine--tRNA ligase [Ignisphaera sp.]